MRRKATAPPFIACDVYRPAAIDQLETLAQQVGVDFYGERGLQRRSQPIVAADGIGAKAKGCDAILFRDTAGAGCQIDTPLIDEVKRLRDVVLPDEVLLVAMPLSARKRLTWPKPFHEAVPLSGIVLTKIDGDTRGGAALSMKAVTNVPIKVSSGTGEKVDDLEVFHPDRLASRILGMGDVVLSRRKGVRRTSMRTRRSAWPIRCSEPILTLKYFLTQMRAMRKMGSLGSIMKMIPRHGVKMQVGDKRGEAPEALGGAYPVHDTERSAATPTFLNGSRRARIARGLGWRSRNSTPSSNSLPK